MCILIVLSMLNPFEILYPGLTQAYPYVEEVENVLLLQYSITFLLLSSEVIGMSFYLGHSLLYLQHASPPKAFDWVRDAEAFDQ